MCSYNITLNDSIVEQVKSYFADDKALNLWIQQQMERLLLEHIESQSKTIPPCQYSDDEALQRVIQATADVDVGRGLISHEEFQKQVRSWYK